MNQQDLNFLRVPSFDGFESVHSAGVAKNLSVPKSSRQMLRASRHVVLRESYFTDSLLIWVQTDKYCFKLDRKFTRSRTDVGIST